MYELRFAADELHITVKKLQKYADEDGRRFSICQNVINFIPDTQIFNILRLK